MGIDPKDLDDKSFALAFQQHAKGEEVTGKPWRPGWKPREAVSVDSAQYMLFYCIQELINDAHFSGGGWPASVAGYEIGSNLAYYDAGGASWLRWRLNRAALRLLPKKYVGPPVRIRSKDAHAHIPLTSSQNGMELLFGTMNSGRLGRLRLERVDPSGIYEGNLISLDLTGIYRLIRGIDAFRGWSAEKRADWALNNSHKIVGLGGHLREKPDGKEQVTSQLLAFDKPFDGFDGRAEGYRIDFGRENTGLRFAIHLV